MKQLWITHPETGGVALYSEEAYQEVWAPRGWQPVEIDLAAASAAHGAPIVRLEQLTEDYVREVVAEQAAASMPAPESVETTTSTRRAGRSKPVEEPAS